VDKDVPVRVVALELKELGRERSLLIYCFEIAICKIMGRQMIDAFSKMKNWWPV
jgi:hypothetical protein